MSRPSAVRIDDLAAPRFPDAMAPTLDGMTAMAAQIAFEPDDLMQMAKQQTGLNDFGVAGFVERLGVLCAALRTEARLGPIGKLTVGGLMVQLLKNRLLVEDLIRRHPEIEQVEIVRPIIVCGLPRTGTTHLHNLMAADPALRSLPYWESLEPVLPDAEQPAAGEPDPRLARTEMALGLVNALMPLFERMHEMTVEHVHEEIQLLAIDFSSMLFETTAPMPSWRDYYLAHDQTPHYAYLKRVLQVLTWLRGGDRWVLKSPQHIEQFGPLLATFPDATFVVTHRDPIAVTASVTTMLAYTARMSRADPDPPEVAGYWSDRLERMLRACVRDRDLLPAAQTIDVPFDEFMADDVAMVERIYAMAGQPMTGESRGAMDAFMTGHPRGRFGSIVYDLDELGIDREERRTALAFYVERFGVTLEGER
jgi:hypothetical protein